MDTATVTDMFYHILNYSASGDAQEPLRKEKFAKINEKVQYFIYAVSQVKTKITDLLNKNFEFLRAMQDEMCQHHR